MERMLQSIRASCTPNTWHLLFPLPVIEVNSSVFQSSKIRPVGLALLLRTNLTLWELWFSTTPLIRWRNITLTWKQHLCFLPSPRTSNFKTHHNTLTIVRDMTAYYLYAHTIPLVARVTVTILTGLEDFNSSLFVAFCLLLFLLFLFLLCVLCVTGVLEN